MKEVGDVTCQSGASSVCVCVREDAAASHSSIWILLHTALLQSVGLSLISKVG
jgi:hypothetical protein